LQAVVAGEEIPAALAEGQAVALEVPELREPLPEGRPFRDAFEEAEGDAVLGLDPGLGLGRVIVFQPAVRVFDAHAVQGFDDVGFRGDGVGGLGQGVRSARRARGATDQAHRGQSPGGQGQQRQTRGAVRRQGQVHAGNFLRAGCGPSRDAANAFPASAPGAV
jgi:hypothetical protein